jgi:hypothetical protein
VQNSPRYFRVKFAFGLVIHRVIGKRNPKSVSTVARRRRSPSAHASATSSCASQHVHMPAGYGATQGMSETAGANVSWFACDLTERAPTAATFI